MQESDRGQEWVILCRKRGTGSQGDSRLGSLIVKAEGGTLGWREPRLLPSSRGPWGFWACAILGELAGYHDWHNGGGEKAGMGRVGGGGLAFREGLKVGMDVALARSLGSGA